jgi:predicted RND superfamily exporter protein
MSFLLALSVITLVISVFLRDAVMSAISLIVNFMPVLLTMGLVPVLAAIGLINSSAASLNVSTVMVPSLAMAIAVDDTIHFLFCFRQSQAKGASVHEAIDHALHGAGFAMIATTAAMVVGLTVLLFSQLSANQEFSAMMSVALIAALISDLLLLPHLIQRWKN